ncbi:hypothetical protein JXA32_00485 [Candidatus Sumerlaeota bacterium]|nr:hypothetical protein [Candidatus Sumerlaeota bacterium]
MGAVLFRPRVVLFVALLGLYLYAIVDARLIFQLRDKIFLWNLRFFMGFTGQSGALLEWSDSLLVQLCYRGWPGALALSAITWLLFASTIGFMNASGRANIGGTWIIPGIFFIWLFGKYSFHTSTIVGSTMAMALANGWARLPVKRIWLRLPLFAAFSAAIYYIAGEAGFYCFAACCIIYETLAEKRRLSGIWMLLIGAGVKFGLPPALASLNLTAWTFHPPFLNDYLRIPRGWHVTLFYCYFPACALFVIYRQTAVSWIKSLGRKSSETPQDKDVEQERATGVCGRIRWMTETLLLLSLAAAAGLYGLDRDRKALLEIDYCSEHQQWKDVLEQAANLPPQQYTPYVNHDVNLALYHTGHLPDRMFSYPQKYMALLFQEQVPEFAMLRKPCDLLLELGRVNEAEHKALEMMELWPTGGALKRVALAKMIKGQIPAATVLLNVLRDDLVWGRWAEGYLQRLAEDPELASNEEIQRIRQLMVTEDDLYLYGTFTQENEFWYYNPPALLSGLLKKNGRNQMTFECLMAMYLFNDNVQAAVETFSYLDNFSYPSVPLHYEEAAMIYGTQHPEEIKQTPSGIFIRGLKISPATEDKCRRYLELVRRYRGFKKEAEPDVVRELEGSYFQYYYLSRCGDAP